MLPALDGGCLVREEEMRFIDRLSVVLFWRTAVLLAEVLPLNRTCLRPAVGAEGRGSTRRYGDMLGERTGRDRGSQCSLRRRSQNPQIYGFGANDTEHVNWSERQWEERGIRKKKDEKFGEDFKSNG